MKKFLAIALIAASFVACNEGEKTETTTTPAGDSAAVSNANATIDSANMVKDSANAVIDSAKAVKDSVKH